MSISGDYRLDTISDEAASKLDKAVEEARAVHVQIEALTSTTDYPYRVFSYEGDETKKNNVEYLKKLITPDLKAYLMYVNCIGDDGLTCTFIFREDA